MQINHWEFYNYIISWAVKFEINSLWKAWPTNSHINWTPKDQVCELSETLLNFDVYIFSFTSLINLKKWQHDDVWKCSLPISLAASIAVFWAVDWLWIRQNCAVPFCFFTLSIFDFHWSVDEDWQCYMWFRAVIITLSLRDAMLWCKCSEEAVHSWCGIIGF